jgi:hypothetical protein
VTVTEERLSALSLTIGEFRLDMDEIRDIQVCLRELQSARAKITELEAYKADIESCLDMLPSAKLYQERLERADAAEAQLAALQREHAASAARVLELEANAGKLPKEPPPGLLISMALRQDHGLGVPGYYDATPWGDAPVAERHWRRFQGAVNAMRQLYEEASGHGFWSPENDCEYVATYVAAQPDAARPAGASCPELEEAGRLIASFPTSIRKESP